ncbi:hypothetical protein GALMADRAFT_581559 [Galerina marginata CBS 339.88]|uniref:F-box domain-containing protein n=1 Tax=Galerina marginata (strain CBS 339.88) TaxID=685588 RepID=A0A067SWF4_GALM3|nr:hypothetical protein GALMADRAFT_581559 [Galerina marginata CBS 339.88]
MTKRREVVRHENGSEKVAKPPMHAPFLLLPAELIFLILASCSNAMLVALAQTCKTFNTIALQLFFERGKGKFRTPVEGTLTTFRAPAEMLDATRAALFVKRLPSVKWSFEAGCECAIFKSECQEDPACPFRPSESRTSADIANMLRRAGPLWHTFDEIANLRAIFGRIQKSGWVSLDFSWVDRWLDSLERTHPQLWSSAVHPDMWNVLVDLLDKIVGSGCYRLLIGDGKALSRLLPGKDAKEKDVAVTTPSKIKWKHLNLQSLSVYSEILLRPPFSDWLLSLLTSTACSRSLTHLSFLSNMASLPSSLLVSLNLPKLRRFAMHAPPATLITSNQEGAFANFGDMSAFLAAHSHSLMEVSLDGIEQPPPQMPMDTTTVSSSDFSEPVFPKLESFTAHPAYVAWLFYFSVRSQSEMTLGSLTTVKIKSDNCSYDNPSKEQHFDYTLFDKAFEALVSWQNSYRSVNKVYETLSRSKNKNSEPRRAIELSLEFVCQHGIDKWFASHLPPTQKQAPNLGMKSHSPAPSILTQLTGINTLILSFSGHFPANLSEETVNIFPDWLALFSNASNLSRQSQHGVNGSAPEIAPGTSRRLRKVEIVEFEGDKDEFIKEIAKKCTALKWVQVGGKRNNPKVNLDELRARVRTENDNNPDVV